MIGKIFKQKFHIKIVHLQALLLVIQTINVIMSAAMHCSTFTIVFAIMVDAFLFGNFLNALYNNK